MFQIGVKIKQYSCFLIYFILLQSIYRSIYLTIKKERNKERNITVSLIWAKLPPLSI